MKCVCVSVPEASNNDWQVWTSYDWLNKFYNFCVADIVGIVSRRGLRIEVFYGNHLKEQASTVQAITSLLWSFKTAVHK